MKYLYGDATPFPLEENFIDTLSAAADACVALFQIDQEMTERRRRATLIHDQSAEELSYLDALARSMESALTPMLPNDDKAVYVAQRTAKALAQSTRTAIEQARKHVMQEREVSIRNTIGHDLDGRIFDALAGFLLGHQLPKTRWGIRWSHDVETSQTELHLAAAAHCKIAAEFTGQLPAAERWAHPLRVSDIDANARISIERDANWLTRLFKGAREYINDFYITRVEIRDEEARFEVQRHLKRSLDGYEIRVHSAAHSSPCVYRMSVDREDADPIPVYGDEAMDLNSLWTAIENDMMGLKRYRSRMLSARLRGVDLNRLGAPSELAEVVLNSLAPIIREMRLRSRVPGELILKRDLGNGRREEMFVPRQVLEEKFASLPYEHQMYFHAAGLGGEATVEFVNRVFPVGEISNDDNSATSASGEFDDSGGGPDIAAA